MSASTRESERYALRDQLAETLGSETAGKLMEHVPPVKWEELATKDDLRVMAAELRVEMREGFAEVKDSIAEVKGSIAELKGSIAEVKDSVAEVKGSIAEVKDSVAEVKDSIAEVRNSVADVKDGIAEHRERIIVTMTGQHRMTMLTLVGLAVSLFVILLMNSPT